MNFVSEVQNIPFREDKYQYLYPGLRSHDVTHKHITGVNKPLMIMDNT